MSEIAIQFAHTLRSAAGSYFRKFEGLPKAIWVLAGVALLNAIGRMVSIFLVLYLSISLALSNTWIGLIVGAYGAGAIIGALIGGRLCRKTSRYRVMFFSLLGAGIGFISLYYVEDTHLFMAIILVSASFEGSFRPALVAVMMQAADAAERTRRYSLYQVSMCLGVTLSAAIGGAISVIEFSLIFWFDGMTCVLAALFLGACRWVTEHSSATRETRRQVETSSSSLWRNPTLLVLAAVALLHYLVFFQRFSTFPLYLTEQYGLNTAHVGVLFAMDNLLMAVSIVLITDRLKRTDHRLAAALGSLVFCAGYASLPLGDTMSFALLAVCIMTLGRIVFLPAFAELIYTCGDSKQAAEALGIYLSINAVCRIAAPIAGLWTAGVFGSLSLWLACGALGVVAALLLVALRPRPPRSAGA